jgi:hypothetical protein
MDRIPLSGKRDADSKLVSVTFSNKSGGSFSLPVRDEHEQGENDERSSQPLKLESSESRSQLAPENRGRLFFIGADRGPFEPSIAERLANSCKDTWEG